MIIQRVFECPNINCQNKTTEGTFVRVVFPASLEGGKSVQLSMCAPCADVIQKDVVRDIERAVRSHG